MRQAPYTMEEIQQGSVVDPYTGCWNWRWATVDGYARNSSLRIHRIAYQIHYRNLDRSMDVHHLCENKSCVFWGHLVAYSRSEHMKTHMTHCHNGHEYVGDSFYVDSRGYRRCRTCMKKAHIRARKVRR